MKRQGLLAILLTLLLSVNVMAYADSTLNPENTVKIYRDVYGVPHVYADTEEALFSGFGYATAQDRLGQMELMKRASCGRMAEILGPSYIDFDYAARLESGGEWLAQQIYEAMDSEEKSLTQAYIDGINAYIDDTSTIDLRMKHGFPFRPRHWTVIEAIAMGESVAGGYDRGGAEYELKRLEILQYLESEFPGQGPVMLEDLLWLYDPDAPTNVPDEGAIVKKGGRVEASQGPDTKEGIPGGVLKNALEEIEKSREVLEQVGIPLHGSEGWVVGAEKSETGHPLITAGPGLGWTRPAGCHEIHLHGGRFDVTGVAIPGVPCLLSGHNNHLAWSAVMAGSDQEDVYIETLHPDDPSSYLFKGNWIRMEVRNETINVRGQRPVVRPVYSTVHGPVIAFDTVNHTALSKKRSGYGKHTLNTSANGFLKMAIATNKDQFVEGVSNLYVSLSIIYADKSGNIAYWLAGKVPDRDFILQLPVPGTGEYEWNGFIPFEEMPHSMNPEKGWLGALPGFLPAKDWMYVGAAGLRWPLEKEVVAELLNNDSSVSFEELRYTNIAAAMTVYHDPAKYLTPFIAEAFDKVGGLGDPRVGAAVTLLENWGKDDYITISEPGAWDEYFRYEATIYETWWQAVKKRVFSDEFGPYLEYVVPNHFRHVVLGENSGVPPSRDYFNGADKNEVIVESLIDALDLLTLEFETADMTQWLVEIPLFFEFDPACLVTHATASTYKYILEVKGRFPGESNIFPGNSEDPNSPHYADQISMYVDFRYKPCLYKTGDILNNLESTTTLTYPFELGPRLCAAVVTDPSSSHSDLADGFGFMFSFGLVLAYLRYRRRSLLRSSTLFKTSAAP